MKNPVIRKEIEQLKQNHMNRELLKQEDIFQKYMDIAFADVTDYVSFGRENIQVMGAFGPVMVENKETGEKEVLEKEVNTVKFKQSEEVDGTLITEVKQGKDGASIKLVDKMKALPECQGLSSIGEVARRRRDGEVGKQHKRGKKYVLCDRLYRA